MKPNEFEIKNNIRVSYGKRNQKVYRGNRPVLCKECVKKYGYPVRTKQEQYDAAEKGIQYVYDNHRIYCPSCNNELKIYKTYDDWLREQKKELDEARRNVHLKFYDKSWSSGLEYYRLSVRLEPEKWEKVKDCFMYLDYDRDEDEQDTLYGNPLRGWLTTIPEEVEKRLGVREELTLKHREKVRRELQRKRNDERDRTIYLRKSIEGFFDSKGVMPDHVRMKDIQGEVLEPSGFRWNVYGGGHRFIINDGECWFIRNNGRDGDDWSLNNVQTGGAGAMGWRVPFDEGLASMIREYCK